MGDPAELKRLLRQMREIASPVQRVKLLARAWRSLRRLDRSELRELAANAGLDRAEEVLERLARGRGRLTPGLLLQGVRKARGIAPQQLADVVAGLRDPAKREELLRAGLEAVERRLPEDRPADEGGEPSEAAAPEPAAGPAPPIAGARPSIDQPVDAESAPTAADRRIETVPPSPVEQVPPEPSAEEPEPIAPAQGPALAAPAALAVEPAPPPSPIAVGGNGLVEAIREAPTLMRRLRLLHQEISRARSLDSDGLRRLLESFPAGWARRRALSDLLRARIPDNLLRAVSLIDRLASPTARRWCVGTILDSWELAPHERDALRERRAASLHGG